MNRDMRCFSVFLVGCFEWTCRLWSCRYSSLVVRGYRPYWCCLVDEEFKLSVGWSLPFAELLDDKGKETWGGAWGGSEVYLPMVDESEGIGGVKTPLFV